jgi:GDP-L-fucose synthase
MKLNKNSKIFLAGHQGMVGSAILRHFKKKGYKKIIVIDRKKLDLVNQNKTEKYIKRIKPEFVIIAAAKVGGILANNLSSADFIYQNIMIQNNVINAAYKSGVKKLLFLGSSCIYPKYSRQPIKEEDLLTGKLEPTNEAYAIAKIAGIKMCEAYNKQFGLNYLSLMPTNLYGKNDNYNWNSSHFFPALISKIYNSKINKKKNIIIWGDGKPKRELMYVDDLADACEFFMKKRINHSLINIGSGQEKSIESYAKFIMKKMNVKLNINYDIKKPKGTPRKILDTSLAKKYGWQSKVSLEEGFDQVFKDYLKKLSI